MIFNFSSYMIFIYFSFYLLNTTVDWSRFLRLDPENIKRSRLLILLFSIALGFILASFFLSLYNMSRNIFLETF
ncbi:hypothetical protein STRDD10_00230 [Streptococcus sp. DD10]|uniref:DUF1146 family protein n=1 Tax=Streptococcus sp. DD10 TaxID=1777878 RepID=UPI0007992007|nr:DUF1146 family protein [Streptococcus sp. DD10]KXT76414.1 hypothetical protein STRDD10_00230 [Streptococcus sp. DD10]